MTRILANIPFENHMPEPGIYQCTIINVEKKVSKIKHTVFLELTISNGENQFNDQLYLSAKALSKLCLVAKRVCGMPDTFELPDGNNETVDAVAKYIIENIIGKKAIVTIEENPQVYIPNSGPDMGRKITKIQRRVAFAGYQTLENEPIPF